MEGGQSLWSFTSWWLNHSKQEVIYEKLQRGEEQQKVKCNAATQSQQEQRKKIMSPLHNHFWYEHKQIFVETLKYATNLRVDTMSSQQQQLNGNKNKQPRRMESDMWSQQQVQAANK